ncbi:hypothetical protein [Pseudarthrobacter albicanus]|uniref:hypothetical protein n=1 Tax=Pseudarthrobacter albicanus TaxID=2823873 RepID=UPI001BAA156B|nr:hypothetical protein [Pseudarthrobacter albicanus]
MKLSYALPLLAASALLLAGCSSSAQAEAQPTLSVAPAQTSTPTPSPSSSLVTNAHGNIPKKVGELGGAGGTSMTDAALKFKPTSIQPITCDAPYSDKPVGTALAVAIEVETSADFKGGLNVNGAPGLTSFDAHYWKGYAANGTRMNKIDTIAAQRCLADESRLLPNSIGMGEKATGIVVLEVTTPTGSIAYDGAGMISGGWEWEYPAK